MTRWLVETAIGLLVLIFVLKIGIGILKNAFGGVIKAGDDIGEDIGQNLGKWISMIYVEIKHFISGFISGLKNEKKGEKKYEETEVDKKLRELAAQLDELSAKKTTE